MKEHTSQFKTQIKELGRKLRRQLIYGNTILEEELYSVTPHYEGSILKSTMKQLDIETTENIPLMTEVNYKLGMYVSNNWEWLDFGNYYVYSSEKQEDKGTYKLICYDKLLNSMKTYEGIEGAFPMTLREYLQAICDKLDIDFGSANDDFANYNTEIPEDRYTGLQEYTYRDVLDEIAQATGSMICLNSDDELVVRYINEGIDNFNTIEGTSFTLNDASGGLGSSITELEGNTTQNGTPTPTSPVEVKTVSGDNEVVVSDEQHVTGNSYRVDLGGKNFLNNTLSSGTNNGITYTVNEDKSVTMNGTATATTWLILNSSISLKAGTYTMSQGNTTNTVRVYCSALSGYCSNGVRTQTITETKTSDIAINIPNGTTISNLTLYPMVENGSVATPYSPYTDNPIELCKIGSYVDKLKRAEGKNKLDNSMLDNVTIFNVKTTLENGLINIWSNGSATNTCDFYFYGGYNSYVDIADIGLVAGNYTLSGAIGGSGTTYMLYIVQNRGGTLYYYTCFTAQGTNISLQEGDKLRIFIRVMSGTTMNNVKIYAQLEEGNQATSPEPYGNNWYIEKNIGKVVYNGTEADSFWSMNTGGGIRRFTQTNGISNLYSNGDGVRYATLFINDHFKNSVNNEEGASFRYNNQIYFYYNTATSVSEWKTWLQSNNVTLYYVLKTPTYEVITNDYLIEQLNNIQNMQLIENLCYVDWVGSESPTMKLFAYLDKDKIIEEITD